MKTEELKSKGLTQEQIDFVMAENGKDLKQLQDDNKALEKDRDTWKKKAETAEGERDNLKGQLDTANTTLEKFKDIDPDKIADEIDGYKKAAETAKAEADKQILQRDQRDYLNAEFDKLEIKSKRTRESLAAEIMKDLTWKDGAFLGLSDFLAKENEKDHFYQTQEEKDEATAKEKAAGGAPKFTDKSEGKDKSDSKPEAKPVPKIW